MRKTKEAHYEVNDSFITGNSQIKCDGDFSSKVYDKFDDYVKGKMTSATTGFGIEMAKSVSAKSSNPLDSASLSVSMLPPMFTRSWNDNKDIDDIQNFFTKEGGSIAVTEAVCLTDRVDIADESKKVLLNGFIESVKSLETFENATKEEKMKEFRRFVEEFGTHYATTNKLGTRIIIERRYNARERSNSDKKEIAECSDRAGAQVLGLQMEVDKKNCTNTDLLESDLHNSSLNRMLISTYGSFLADSLTSWSQQVVTLVEQGSFTGRVIQRELSLITNLFTPQNFEGVLRDDGTPFNVSRALVWFEDMLLTQYCEAFNLTCNATGCGIDDICDVQETCIENVNNSTDLLNREFFEEDRGKNKYSCVLRNSTAVLDNEHFYFGSVNRAQQPHGWGVEYLDAEATNKTYQGEWRTGKRNGVGILFNSRNDRPVYSGRFQDGFMSGEGTLYYKTGRPMFSGTLVRNRIEKGKIFTNGNISVVLDLFDSQSFNNETLSLYTNTELVPFLPTLQ